MKRQRAICPPRAPGSPKLFGAQVRRSSYIVHDPINYIEMVTRTVTDAAGRVEFAVISTWRFRKPLHYGTRTTCWPLAISATLPI